MKVRSPAQFSRKAASTCRGTTMNRTRDHDHPVPLRDAFRPETLNVLNRAGAGFVVPIPLARDRSCDAIMRMPSLPEVLAAKGMDIDLKGVISGFR